MANSLKKRGQKIIRKFSRASLKAGEESKEHIKENLFARISHVENIRLLILEWGLLVFALIMLAATQAFWFGDSYAENTFVDGGTYTEATIGDVNSLNPLFATTNSEKVLSKLMFATISTIDYSGHPGIGIAKSINASDDGKTWTVNVRDGLLWSDGEPITNDDILFTAQLIKDPAVASIYNSNLANVKVSKNEAGEIVFNLPVGYADFISALNIPIVPKHILENTDPKTLIENSFSNSPVTSGAFMLNAIQSSGNNEKVVYLSANPNYYGGEPMLNSFAIHTYLDELSLIRAINNESVTATAEISGAKTDQVTNSHFNQKNSSLNSGAFIFFNTAKEKLKSAELRTAIRQGINLENIRSKARDAVALDYPLTSSQLEISNFPAIPGYDFESAKEKIRSLVGEEPLTVDIATVNSGYLPGVAEAVKEEFAKLGIEANVSTYEENQDFITNIISRRAYDVLVYEIELGSDPDLLPYYHSSQVSSTGLNLSNYKNTLMDDLLLGARDTLDENLRIKKYESFLEQWVANAPAIALYQPNLTYFYNKNVRTFSNDVRLVTALDRFTDVTEWAANKALKNKTP